MKPELRDELLGRGKIWGGLVMVGLGAQQRASSP